MFFFVLFCFFFTFVTDKSDYHWNFSSSSVNIQFSEVGTGNPYKHL